MFCPWDTYRPDGLRNSQTVGTDTTRYIWSGDNIVMTADGSNQLKQKFTYANGLVSMESLGADNTFSARSYYMKNFRGDVVSLTDSTGTVTKTYTYDAFGNEQNPSAADTNPFRYASQFWDGDAGTYYLRARNYAPTIGRFTQADTHWNISNMIYGDKEYKDGEIPYPDITAIMQSNNLYTYCMGNPVMFVDRDGELAYPGQIHNLVVSHIKGRGYTGGKLYSEQRIDYKIGYGRADLISESGAVWEVKRTTANRAKAQAQVLKYTKNTWHNKPGRTLSVGGWIDGGSFTVEIGFIMYYVHYHYEGNGLIIYDYNQMTDWEKVGDTVKGFISVAGTTIAVAGTLIAIIYGVPAPLPA